MVRLIGKKAEDAAAFYLEQRGFKIIAKNVVYVFGELDLVATIHDTLVFIEVKYRKNLFFGEPLDAVTVHKQKKIIRAAKAYLQNHHDELPLCRFDVISLSGELSAPKIFHVEDAFWVEDI